MSCIGRRGPIYAAVRGVHAARDGAVRAGGGVVGAAGAGAARGRPTQGDARQPLALGRAALPPQPARSAARGRSRHTGEKYLERKKSVKGDEVTVVNVCVRAFVR